MHLRFPFSLLIIIMIVSCSEDPIITSSLNTSLHIDTLEIKDIYTEQYFVAPNIGSNQKLYLGKKNNLESTLTFISIGNSPYWDYFHDTTITIDSIRFVVYSEDSLLSSNPILNLYYNPDSQFSENSSTYLEFTNFSNLDWNNIGYPSYNDVFDTMSIYDYTEIIWNIDTLAQSLSDTSDSVINRTFLLQNESPNSYFIELFSEEATTGSKDPKVILYYQKINSNSETVVVDTATSIIYSNGDLSLIEPLEFQLESDSIGLSNGSGMRIKIQIPFEKSSLPEKSLIRTANLILSYDTLLTPFPGEIILDPINEDSTYEQDIHIYDLDPYTTKGFPFVSISQPVAGSYTISIKNILQNVILGNENNLGFKLFSSPSNEPFEYIWFENISDLSKSRLEITYVYY